MKCIKCEKREAASKRWKLCGICWKAQEGGFVDRPPEPIPVSLPPQPTIPKSKIKQNRLPMKSGSGNATTYVYSNIPPEGTPYDWHRNREITWNECQQMIRGIWQGTPSWSVFNLARRFNISTSTVKEILGLPKDFNNQHMNGVDYTPRGPINAEYLPSHPNRKRWNE